MTNIPIYIHSSFTYSFFKANKKINLQKYPLFAGFSFLYNCTTERINDG